MSDDSFGQSKHLTFTLGEKVSIDDLCEADARAIFGNVLYESYQKRKREGKLKPDNATITGISQTKITLGK